MDNRIRVAFHNTTMKSPAEHLAQKLIDNRGRYHIDKYGVITVDFEHPEVKKNILKHIEQLKYFKISSRD
ncbi:hypothetical protein ACA373_01555 [Erwinia sp. STN24]|uniref:hypothetical protein n=1 Tax=Erwinia sp. STN24 TaxID=3233996 RepID=UPI00351FAB9E